MIWSRFGVLVLATACSPLASAQQASVFAGRVVDNLQHGVPNLQVRLRPPENARIPTQISVTNDSGGFTLPRVTAGSYLLEVSQGPYVLYRAQMIAPQRSPMTITVQRR